MNDFGDVPNPEDIDMDNSEGDDGFGSKRILAPKGMDLKLAKSHKRRDSAKSKDENKFQVNVEQAPFESDGDKLNMSSLGMDHTVPEHNMS